ncbi:phycobiliprotein lyase [Spirulina subsalsa FACHB-351]|uniref:Chromophore lyase CpcS/CpeS n=1 Tax=Spirulina subsalsa FACHB-351 TaxID=234711 RepID=A0ABT3L3Y3_9CYAN|nr:phycobiliprotein lyase [Spirulina subsalsa]MCW6036221.1 phycobiliprotein lyase [Spirulina subsalsa FACHB-351]
MDINEFLEQCAGKWFSQRTSYQLVGTEVDNSKSDLTVEILPPQDPTVASLSASEQITPEQILGGLKMSWDNSVDWGKPKQVGFSLMVMVPDSNNQAEGQLIRSAPPQPTHHGRYILADDTLTLIIEEDSTYAEERIWFASPNLRLRTSLVRQGETFVQTGFYSEIRRMTQNSDQ